MSNLFYTFIEHEPNETYADAIIKWNIYLKDFLIHNSWYVRLVLGFLLTCWILCYARDCNRKLDLKRRRQEHKRARERHTLPTQQRGPISRNADGSVRELILTGDNVDVDPKTPYMVIRSPTGIIYGSFEEEDKTKMDEIFNCNCFKKGKK